MRIGRAIGQFLQRRLVGGTMEDYGDAMERAAAAYEPLPHEDPELERRLPRSALGRPLATWSVGAGARDYLKEAALMPSRRKYHEMALRRLGLRWEDFSMAGTIRVDRRDPLASVQGARYRGAGDPALAALPWGELRGAAMRGDSRDPAKPPLPVAGLELQPDRVWLSVLPDMAEESDGYRLVVGDVVFELLPPFDLGAGHEEMAARRMTWLDDVVDQLAHGPRYAAPTFVVDLPDGWWGMAMSDENLAALADRHAPLRPDSAEMLRRFPVPLRPETTYLAYDLAPEAWARFPTSVKVWEFPSWESPFEEEAEVMRSEFAAIPGVSDLTMELLTVPAGPAARFTFKTPGPPEILGQPYLVRAGERSYSLDGVALWEDRQRYSPILESIVRSLRVTA